MNEPNGPMGIAIVGMAVRTPGAADLESFWQALLEGRDLITHFSEDQLDPLVPAALRENPHFVAARGVLEEAECFDAGLFGMSANQARLLDPQQRVFLELCWHALEDAGIDPARSEDTIGVYASSANNTWLAALRQTMPELIERNGEFATMLANEKDYIATRVAHKLNLDGPAIGVYTACSSSLVAITQAWYALMNYQCDAALAGGICVIEPQAGGYLAVEGGMESPNGACRPFDADADGTVFSSGGGCVVLKRVEDAQATNDTIYAIIRGVGVNNDGANKASFTAPSPTAQTAAIRMALAQAGVDASSIGYVEAHGTGTALGDPIEITALRDAFALHDQPGHCVLGSVKGNIGHLTVASGVVGLIKAVLCLERGQIPPTAHFRHPNPRTDFANTPFRVLGETHDWPRGTTPRRAGVSSFGVGGTNAHVILEEAALQPVSASKRRHHVLPLSAHGEDELAVLAKRMTTALTSDGPDLLADTAWTLATGRSRQSVRVAVVASDSGEAVRLLQQPLRTHQATLSPRQVWLFPGQGSQYPGMAAALWHNDDDFRAALEPLLVTADDIDARLRPLLLNTDEPDDEAAKQLAQTELSQPALFMVSYAMARALRAHGLQPDAMIGHSIGEYVAACLAGVFDPDDALRLVARRGALMQAQPHGGMAAVYATAEELGPHLVDGVDIACYNAENLQAISGSHEALQLQMAALEQQGIRHSRLKVSHAFHSPLMDGALAPFARAVAAATPKPPQQLFYACPDGEPISAEQAVDPNYWAGQIRAPVRFADSLRHALADTRPTLIMEVGPGRALSALARNSRGPDEQIPLAVIGFGARAGVQDSDEDTAFAQALGDVWANGAPVNLSHRYARETRRNISLPGYPFRRDHYGYTPLPAVNQAPGPTTMPDMPIPMASADLANNANSTIVGLLADVSGEPVETIDPAQNFVSLGLDSLLLTQFTLALEQRLGLKLRFRRLLEDLDTPEKLAAHAQRELPPETWAVREATTSAPSASVMPVGASTLFGGAPANDVHALIASQLQLMEQQTQLLRKLAGGDVPEQSIPVANISALAVTKATEPKAGPEPITPGRTHSAGFGASARISLERGTELEPAQQQWLDAFIDRYVRRTSASRSFTQRYRQVMADPRVVTGFDPRFKEMVYPIVVDRSRGARLWDINGNEYIDLLNGFGSNFLGYQPPFIAEALQQQITSGYEIGPQHPLAAEVSELIAQFTGLPRVALCNTGSEAVMGAMRIARTVTGRDTIAIFRDSYHGIFDEAVVRGTSRFEARPAAPGITASATEHMLVLEYGNDDALRILRERSGELAAIMIEPIQARHPELRPRAFVKTLRGIADEIGCALIFDEVITGFRIEPGGAQAYYDVSADIATYGKIIGGGLPFAAIAGKPRWMDALDGGDWRFGDDSQPEAGVTYFAGTFVRHPLALAAARASLRHLEQAGPALQQSLNKLTGQMCERLNTHFRQSGAPIEAVFFSSIWRLRVDASQNFASLLFYLLRHHGLHLYEQFGCFLSAAHGEDEVTEITTRIEQSVDELMGLGLLQARDSSARQAAILTPSKALVDPNDTSSTAAIPLAAAAPEASMDVTAPMTEGQLEKWLVCQYGDEAVMAYNEGVMLRLDGALDHAALRAALEDIWARHAALRIAIDNRQQRQTVVDCALPFTELDLSDGGTDRLEQCSREQMATPFDLSHAPLIRIHLIHLGRDAHVLHVVGHHLVLDGWSLAVFVRELATCYNARRAGLRPDLPKATSFLAYARDERARRSGRTTDLDYWQQELADAPDALILGRDHGVDRKLSFDADTLRHDFSATRLLAVRKRAGMTSVTPFSVLLSAFAVLLWRLSGKRDVVLCIPFAGQAMAGARDMIGDGVNTLPLRIRINPAETLSQLLKRVHTKVLDASDHQDTTLLGIMRRLGEARLRGNQPLSGIIFNLNPAITPPHFDGLNANLRDCRRSHGAWDLFFNFYDTGRELTLDLHYDYNWFQQDDLKLWLAQYAELLDVIGQDTDPLVDSLLPDHARPVATAAASILLSDSQLETPPDVLQLIERQVRDKPASIAVVAGTETMSYADLWQRSGELAAYLVAQGVEPGEMVGVCVSRDAQMPLALLAVLRAGGAYVPLDPAFPDARLAWMVEDSGLKHVVVGQSTPLPNAISASGAQRHTIGEMRGGSALPTLPVVQADAPAYVIYTSGSTGKPKGVRVLHRNLGSFLVAMQRSPGMQASEAIAAITTLSFDIAGLEMYLPLASGARMVIANHDQVIDPHRLLALIVDHGVTVLQTTPSLLRMLLASDGTGSLRGVRILVGGEGLPLDLAQKAAASAREVWNMYGPTETTIWSSVWEVPRQPDDIAIGRPITGTSLYVLDSDRQAVAQGSEGEIWIAGPGVTDGYLGRADLTAERFVPDPFSAHGLMYRTGDVGRIDNELAYCLGRIDDQIKLRGHRIELGEIEAVARSAQGVADAAAAVREAGPGDERLVVYAVADGVASAEGVSASLNQALHQQLPDYMQPQHTMWLEHLPTTPNGKLDRRALPMPVRPRPAQTPKVASNKTPGFPETDAEQALATAWCEMIGIEHVAASDNFFELGGHSLLAVEMITRLEDETGIRLNLINIASGTARSLAHELAAGSGPAQPKTWRTKMRTMLSGSTHTARKNDE